MLEIYKSEIAKAKKKYQSQEGKHKIYLGYIERSDILTIKLGELPPCYKDQELAL